MHPYPNGFICRVPRPKHCLHPIDYTPKMVSIGPLHHANLRNCYAETLELSSDEFVTMILLDAVFLIELFLRGFYPDFIKSWTVDQLSADLWLLENQLPVFILNELFELAKNSNIW
ncbi:hypothetical protein CICLE_v10017781mg [Citrus x clementina]|uniref:Uncharacterized protein n=1 Tax=Citrus clementina TaxID=85681 RepID=V4TG19_CITCL|nr:hypothetical protein CICLE_v10017781mg [Citrus x clementina]